MSISFKLEVFEGPLDLLLHLISKHKLNINDIPIMTLVEQYLAYISDMAEQDMEVAGEFLEMAARLIYIKTVSLLPRKEEAETLKKELEGRLIEYSLCKAAAQLMREKYLGDAYSVKKPMEIEVDSTYSRSHDPAELLNAYRGMEIKREKKPPELAPSAFSKIVSKKFVSVSSKIVTVLKMLYKEGKCSLEGMFSGITDRSERVAAFLAVLELTKTGRILLNDDNTEVTFNTASDIDYNENTVSEWETDSKEESENEADG
ncbi:MAG: segregation and condensation protein A [Huintestinicola sp.]|uniref:segregation and condensation protein A n=1 Tax=Huintestinicola sp. TaxID=2981661 RepID=UPI003F0FD4B7